MPAVYLRVKVLEAQNRKPEMESLPRFARQRHTHPSSRPRTSKPWRNRNRSKTVRQHALEKQAALTTDPVTRLQLRYALIRLYESRKDFPAAQKNVEALYRENPKILGVVRSTVDFYWRMKIAAASHFRAAAGRKGCLPALSVQFTYEAARKSTDAKAVPAGARSATQGC